MQKWMRKMKIDAVVYKDNTWDEPTRRKAPYLMIFYKAMQLIVHQLNELKTTFII